MERSKHARIYSLVLDPADHMAALLIAAIDTYLAIQAAERPRITSDKYEASCPYCSWSMGYSTERRSRQALSAHIRQIHPLEFKK